MGNRNANGRRARRVRALLTSSVVAVLGCGALSSASAAASTAPVRHSAPSTAAAAARSAAASRDVTANLFEWNWNSVAGECTSRLGPDGYGAVQVAPPAESISLPGNGPSHPWWEVYQPVSYQLNSRMGNRAQFAAMVTACHNAGVKVYADAVLNHMTGHTSGTGYAGSTFVDKFAYPSVYSFNDFHHYPANCPNADGQIHNYGNQRDVQECELVELADLNTGADYVRGALAGYLNDLLGLGVDGFRLDAAKHINAADISAIESRLSRVTFIYQEVMPGGAVNPDAYEGNGNVLEFTYGKKLKEQFQGNISNLQTFGQTWGLEPAAASVTFVDNHDTDRNGSTLTASNGSAYTLANVFHLAWGYGTAQVYSSFAFTNNDQSPPADGNGFVTDTNCTNGAWTCTNRNAAIVGMVGWHNAVAGTAVGNWWSDGSNRISFSRGSNGFLAINNTGAAFTRTFTTGLATGSYCDVIHGKASGGHCSAGAVTVAASGQASITVQANDAVAIDVAATGSGSTGGGSVALRFNELATTFFGQNVYLVGSIPALGSWNAANAVALSSAGYPTWSATVSVPTSTTFQYKYIKKNPDGSVIWESDPNRSYASGSGGSASVSDSWR